MTSIYITEHGAFLHKKGGKLVIDKDDAALMEVPLELVEDITIVNTAQISASLITECFAKNIPVSWISTSGNLIGSLSSHESMDILKHKQQFDLLAQERFYFKVAQEVVSVKTHNQLTLLRRYNRSVNSPKAAEMIDYIVKMRKNIKYSSDANELMGYEGLIGRSYFAALGSLVAEPFAFERRTRQPPRNPFNSMLSLGYSMLFNEVLSAITAAGLHPYVGFLHQLKKGHPALASDLMEEWRAVIIDSLVMALVNRGSVKANMFTTNKSGCFFTPEGRKVFLAAYNKKLRTENKYTDGGRTYRESIRHQCREYARAVMNKEAELYEPVKLR